MTSLHRHLPRYCAGLLLALSVGNSTRAQTSRDTAATTNQQLGPLAPLLRSHGYTAIPLSDGGVAAVINTTPATLLLDSGTSGNISITSSLADAAGVRGTPTDSAVGIGGKTVADTGYAKRFVLGTVAFDSQFVIIRHSPGKGGLLGARWFAAYGAIVDYAHNVLYVCKASNACAVPPHGLEHNGTVAIPLRRVVKNTTSGVRCHYLLDAVINSKPVTLILDTGAEPALAMDARRAETLGLTTDSSGVPVAGTAGHEAVVHPGRLHALILGALRLDSLPFVSVDLSGLLQRARSNGFPGYDGVLGDGVLATHNAVIDYGHNMLYLEK